MLVEGLARALKARSFHPEERAAMARHIAHRQPELGIHPDVLTPEGMSDSQIDALSALALQAAAHIAHARIAAASAEPGGADHPAGHGYVVIGVN